MIRVFLLFFFFFSPLFCTERASLCLMMVVHNEEDSIKATLEPLRSIIDSWVILDLGSEDHTKECVLESLFDIPGQLLSGEFMHLKEALSHLLELAQTKADYLLFLNPEESFENFHNVEELTKDAYLFPIRKEGDLQYETRVVKSNLKWKWINQARLELFSPAAKSYELAIQNILSPTLGKRFHKYAHKRLLLLKEKQAEDPQNPSLHFEIARLYLDAGMPYKAYSNFQLCLEQTQDREERIDSLYHIATLEGSLHFPINQVVDSYMRALLETPQKSDILYRLSHYLRTSWDFFAAYHVAKMGTNTPSFPRFIHWSEGFNEKAGLLLEYVLNTFYLNLKKECLQASFSLSSQSHISEEVRSIGEEILYDYFDLGFFPPQDWP